MTTWYIRWNKATLPPRSIIWGECASDYFRGVLGYMMHEGNFRGRPKPFIKQRSN